MPMSMNRYFTVSPGRFFGSMYAEERMKYCRERFRGWKFLLFQMGRERRARGWDGVLVGRVVVLVPSGLMTTFNVVAYEGKPLASENGMRVCFMKKGDLAALCWIVARKWSNSEEMRKTDIGHLGLLKLARSAPDSDWLEIY